MVALIDCGSSKVKDIQSLLVNLQQQVTTITLNQITKDMPTNWDAIVISGSPFLLKDRKPSTYLPYLNFLTTYNKPVLGICFGHQAIGLAFGAKASMGKEDRENRKINLLDKNHFLFNNLPPYPIFNQDHCEEITLPDNFTLLANSTHCENEVMAHNSKPIYGVQFHPESSGENGKALLQNFCALL